MRGTPGGFRPYYDADVWLEEGYAFTATPVGDLRAGKERARLRPRDDTFEGNLFSDNGVSRNPDWGAGVAGETRIGYNTVTWALRWDGLGDRTSYEETGRGASSEPGTKRRRTARRRASPTSIYKGLVTLRPGVSGSTVRLATTTGGPASG